LDFSKPDPFKNAYANADMSKIKDFSFVKKPDPFDALNKF